MEEGGGSQLQAVSRSVTLICGDDVDVLLARRHDDDTEINQRSRGEGCLRIVIWKYSRCQILLLNVGKEHCLCQVR